MGGSSKSQTVGYRYRMGLHLALCQGPVDAVQEIQMGDRTAWGDADRAPLSSGHGLTTLSINKPTLFGGDEREGGVVGNIDVLPGGPGQGDPRGGGGLLRGGRVHRVHERSCTIHW